jgi:hypothetical protein
MRPVALVFILIAGCSTYKPGSFVNRGEPFVGELTTAGCLDLAVAVTRDAVAPGPVVTYQFGNRCDRAQRIDLQRVTVTGRTSNGEEVAMVPYDPYGEMMPLPLDARAAGRERIEYRKASDLSSGDMVSVCVAIGALAEEGTSTLAVTCHQLAPTSAVAEVSP